MITSGKIKSKERGEPWTAKALSTRCRALGFTAYSLRHSWATDAILRGIDLQTIAVLMGHSDLKMLSRIYSHLQRCDRHLQDSLVRATA